MKKLLSIMFLVFITNAASAQVSQTVNVTTAGTLSTLASAYLSTVTNLTVTGNIDARDVKTMRDNMPLLAVLDISAVSIKAYTGFVLSNSNVIYPDNEMPSNSFYNSSATAGKTTLKTITLPNSITSIGTLALMYCSGITSLTLPASLTLIDDGAFQSCSGITSLNLPASLTSIGDYAFNGCSGINSLTIPTSLTSIGYEAFNCSGITEFKVEGASLNFSSINGVIFNKNKSSIILYPRGKQGSYIVPNSVNSIGDRAFYHCSGITSLTLPNSVISTGTLAFSGCTGITSLNLPATLTSIGDYAFSGCSGIKIINCLNTIPPTLGTTPFSGVVPIFVFVPTTAAATYKAASGWSTLNIVGEKRVTFNNSVAGGLSGALITAGFGPLSAITHLTLTGNLNSIDFTPIKTNMTNLTEIDISGATIIDNSLPANAFQSKTSLTSLTIPTSITSIGDYAFDGCTNLLGSIPLPAAVTSIGNYAFQNCKSLTGSLTIPTAVTTIGASVFSGCSNLTGTLTISNIITSIGASAFSGCSRFTGTLTLPNTISSIGASAFLNCSGFSDTLTLPNTITTVPTSTFSGCSGFTGILNIPLSVSSIAASAFNGLSKLTELNICKNATTIGDNAFNGCVGLTKISVHRPTPPTIYTNTFGGVIKDNCILEVPTGSSLAYQAANFWKIFVGLTESTMADNFYIITIQLGTNGVVKDNNINLINNMVVSVDKASTKTFSIIPKLGYEVASLTYGGVDVKSQLVNNKYSTPAVNANDTLSVTFSKLQYNLGIKSAETGTANIICDYGATFNFNFTPATGWKVSTVFYNDVDVTNSLVNGVFTVPAITANSLLNVTLISTSADAPELVNSKVKVYTNASDIIIEGSTKGESISLFTLNGIQIQTIKSDGGRMLLPAQHDAIYLLKASGRTFKVAL